MALQAVRLVWHSLHTGNGNKKQQRRHFSHRKSNIYTWWQQHSHMATVMLMDWQQIKVIAVFADSSTVVTVGVIAPELVTSGTMSQSSYVAPSHSKLCSPLTTQVLTASSGPLPLFSMRPLHVL